MGLSALFPDRDVLFTPIEGIAPGWRMLLEMDRTEARASVAEKIGLGRESEAGHIIRSGGEIGVLVPKRRRNRQRINMYRLAIQLSTKYAMTFQAPAGVCHNLTSLPPEYVALASELGSCSFTQFSGSLISPFRVEEVSDAIRASLDERVAYREFTPFFSHGTGDYDCFSASDFKEVLCFNHESREFSPVKAIGFSDWFDYRFREAVGTLPVWSEIILTKDP